MEYQKITNLLGTTIDEIPRFTTKKWVEVYDQSGNADDRYKPNKQIRFKTSILRSDLCDYSDAHFVVRGTITVTNPNNDEYDKEITLKNNAPFVSCILKINNTLIDNAEDLDLVTICLCTICLNTAKTIKKQQDVFGNTIEMNQTKN